MTLNNIDKHLLKQCLSKEPGAWNDFVDRFLGLFIHIIQHTAQLRSVNLTQADIDDLCADVFLELLENNYAVLRNFKGRCSLATYLTVVTRRIVVKKITERRMAEAFGHVQAHGASLDKAEAKTAKQVKRVDDRDEVEHMLEDLSPVEADIVRLYHLEQKSYREIAAELEVPEGTIGSTLSRAKSFLRERQLKHG